MAWLPFQKKQKSEELFASSSTRNNCAGSKCRNQSAENVKMKVPKYSEPKCSSTENKSDEKTNGTKEILLVCNQYFCSCFLPYKCEID